MNKEYDNVLVEYKKSTDYVPPEEQLNKTASEYFEPAEEYFSLGEEYTDAVKNNEIYNIDKDIDLEKKKQKKHRKTLQNMVYAIASVATVAVLTQAAEPDKLVSGSYLEQMVPMETSGGSVEENLTEVGGNGPFSGGQSIAGITIVFSGSGELTQEKVQEKLAEYELDGAYQVIIEEGITSIGDYAFVNCYELTSVEIPESVTEIGRAAFQTCNKLRLEKLSTSGRSIDDEAFEGVTIGELEISESLVLKGASVFAGAEIESVKFEEGIQILQPNLFAGCDSLTEIKIPSGVTSIGDYAFVNCSNLTNVEIPASVTEIGRAAFRTCYKLRLEKLSTSGRSIDDEAFEGVTIGELEISESLVLKGGSVFAGAEIESVKFEEGIQSLQPNLFAGCDSLTEIKIPSGVTSIGDYAFVNCYELTSVEIPASVTEIGRAAFRTCNKLRLEKLSTSGRSIDDEAFEGVTIGELEISESLVLKGASVFAGAEIESVKFEEGIQILQPNLFAGCDSLTEIKIPSGVTSIGDYAFVNCSNLTSVEIPASVTEIGMSAFRNCNKLKLDVSAGSYAEAYAVSEGIPY